MKLSKLNLMIAAGLALSLTACEDFFESRVVGSGNIVQEERQLDEFSHITLEGAYEITLVKEDGHGLVIETDDNIIPLVSTNVNQKGLKVTTNVNYRTSSPIKIRISMSSLNSVGIIGSAVVRSDDEFSGEFLTLNICGSGSVRLNTIYDQIDAVIDGSGRFDLSGETLKQNITILGSGNYYGFDLISDDAKATIIGSGNINLQANQNLTVKINGSGNVIYSGTPVIESDISGSGHIIKK